MMTKLIVPSHIEWLHLDGRPSYGINPYRGCSFGCTYPCWAQTLARIPYPEWRAARLRIPFPDGGLIPRLQAEAQSLLKSGPPGNILLQATADLYQPHPWSTMLTHYLLTGLLGSPHQVYVLTKAAAVVRDKDLLVHLRARVGFTLTSLGRTPQEPYAPDNRMRMMAMRELHRAGVFTFASIEPWLPGVTDPRAIVQATRGYCDWYIIGRHNYRRVDPHFYGEHLPALVAWIKAEGIPCYIKRDLAGVLAEPVGAGLVPALGTENKG